MATKACRKCGKDMGRDDGGLTIEGIKVAVQLDEAQRTPASIDYYNRQLGKYSSGDGSCDVSICYECYIDTLFGLKEVRHQRT
jgi:hypothetical protein